MTQLGRPKGQDPGKYRNRFAKHYYAHQEALLAAKRRAYHEKRTQGKCIRCRRWALHGIIFCQIHAPPHKSVLQKILKL